MKLCLFLLSFIISSLTFAQFSRSDHLVVVGKKFNTKIFEFDLEKVAGYSFRSDVIRTAAAAPIKRSKGIIKSGNVPKKNDDLVFYSYGKKKKATKPKKAKPEVNKASQKILASALKVPAIRSGKPESYTDYTKLLSAAYEKKTGSTFGIEVDAFYLNKKKEKLTNFEITPYYNFNERLSDFGDGTVEIPIGRVGFSTFKGRLASSGIYPVNFELAVSSDDLMVIPTMGYEKVSRLLSQEQVDEGSGVHLLIELTENVDSTQLESKYGSKVLLNKNLNITDAGSSYRYEFYMNVTPGNQLLQIMNLKGEVTEKIIHLSEDEITYDIPELTGKKNVNLSLYEEHLTSLKNVPLDIEGKNITVFNTKIGSTKKSVNNYSVPFPETERTFRSYVKIERSDTIYVGVNRSKKVVLPSREYVDYVMKLFNLDENSSECIIQFNLSKSATEFLGDMSVYRQSNNVDVIFMDKDGTVGKELTGLTNKVFVVGSGNGVFNSKVTYRKNETQYLQSFCNDSLYIVEQI